MMRRAGTALWLSTLLLPVLLAAFTASGDSQPPEITDWRWEPKYPIHPQNVTLLARVTDPDGVAYVEGTWCYYNPLSVCLFVEMTDPDGDGVYTAIPEAGGYSTIADAQGAYYTVSARDGLNNIAATEKAYSLFVDSLDVTLETDLFSAEPGGAVAVNGTLYYEANASAPAEGVIVTVAAGSAGADGFVDASGAFSIALTAPATEGAYVLTATATDRSLTGDAEGFLSVSTVPMPDLTIVNVQVSPAEPVAGQPVEVRFDVRNVGTADALDVRVVVDVRQETGWTPILDERVPLARGRTVALSAQWTPSAGLHTIRIRVDPDDEVPELNEEDGVRTLTADVRGSDVMPLLAAGVGLTAVAVVGGIAAVRLRRKRRPPREGEGI